MNVVLTLGLAVLLLALQSGGVPPFSWWEVSADLVLCLVVRLAMTRDLPVGGALAVAIGALTDVASGAPLGMHVVVFTSVFLVGFGIRSRLFLDSVPTIAASAFMGSLLASVVTMFLVAVFLSDYHQYGRFVWLALPRALLTAVFMFPVRSLAVMVDERTQRASAFGHATAP